MNQENKPLISVVIPTYNSAKTLKLVLPSIREQDVDQERLEILVVDGGSTDDTVKLARTYGARVIPNPRRLPVPALCIGFNEAKGRYCVITGADEVYIAPDQLSRRMDVFKKHPEVKSILANRLLTPKHMGFSCSYVNIYGDPFTQFVAQVKGTMIDNMWRNLVIQEGETYIFRFDEAGAPFIGDGGTTTIDMDYVRKEFSEELKAEHFASLMFFEVARKSRYAAVIKSDNIMHYSAASFGVYLKKLVYRIINNIFDVEQSGYGLMAQTNKKLSRRKYLYPLYCFSVVLPVIDAIVMSIKFKDAKLLAHPFYCYFVLFTIMWMYIKKIFGQSLKNKAYVSGKE